MKETSFTIAASQLVQCLANPGLACRADITLSPSDDDGYMVHGDGMTSHARLQIETAARRFLDEARRIPHLQSLDLDLTFQSPDSSTEDWAFEANIHQITWSDLLGDFVKVMDILERRLREIPVRDGSLCDWRMTMSSGPFGSRSDFTLPAPDPETAVRLLAAVRRMSARPQKNLEGLSEVVQIIPRKTWGHLVDA